MKISSIIEFLCNQFDSEQYDKDILKYGLEVLIYNTLTIAILIILSLIYNNLYFGLIFIPVFSILRITIGGFHCKTVFGCTSLMIIIYTIVFFLISLPEYNYLLHKFSLFLIFLLIFIKPCEENTIHIGKYDIYLKFIIILIFILNLIFLSQSSYFIPSFSALLTTELMYFAYLLKS
ncbi:accessory gene regulator B family protein [Thomasclavelia cocleata]|uniref:accessory gene regulator B family protein n=1 Tax=Thomasclavelia cocleata TaxID=69824 RepID=UPI00332867DB